MTKFGYKVDIDNDMVGCVIFPSKEGEWGSTCKNSFRKITKVTDNPTIMSDFDVQVGQKAYVVWIEHSFGNELGWANRGRTEVIGLFLDKEAAQELVDDLSIDLNVSDNDYFGYDFDTKDGQVFHYDCAEWSGKYHRLDEIHLEEVTIKEIKD